MIIKPYYVISALLMMFPISSFAADSSIKITGNVLNNSCTVDVTSKNIDVNLMNHASKQLLKVGAKTPLVPFTIVFSECNSNASGVKIAFSGDADIDDIQLLKLTPGPDSALGVGIQILNSNEQIIPINKDIMTLPITKLTPGISNRIDFFANLITTKIPITPGKVNATATFTLEFQ